MGGRGKSSGIGNEPYTGIRSLENDFKNGKGSTLIDHYSRHGNQLLYKDVQVYLNAARLFFNKPLASSTESFTTKQGAYFRYDKQTNEFGVINKYGGISTYFKPNDGINYWYKVLPLSRTILIWFNTNS